MSLGRYLFDRDQGARGAALRNEPQPKATARFQLVREREHEPFGRYLNTMHPLGHTSGPLG